LTPRKHGKEKKKTTRRRESPPPTVSSREEKAAGVEEKAAGTEEEPIIARAEEGVKAGAGASLGSHTSRDQADQPHSILRQVAAYYQCACAPSYNFSFEL
jgi:hypothetical protein